MPTYQEIESEICCCFLFYFFETQRAQIRECFHQKEKAF